MRRTKVIALSRCLNKYKKCEGGVYYRFHFKGVFLGHVVKEMSVSVSNKKSIFQKGHDYLLYLEVSGLNENRLETSLIRYKDIDNI